MIDRNPYYPKQMNGPIISAYGKAVDQEFRDAEIIQDYLGNLTILNADETELENIGKLIGYVRPLVPEGFNAENVLLLGPDPITQDEDIGLSGIDITFGGQLSTVVRSESNFMSLGTYRKFLQNMAILKRYGITLASVDKIVSTIDTDYTIAWDENKDIVVSFGKSIGYKNIWILTQLFYRIATAPQVIITAGANIVEEEA